MRHHSPSSLGKKGQLFLTSFFFQSNFLCAPLHPALTEPDLSQRPRGHLQLVSCKMNLLCHYSPDDVTHSALLLLLLPAPSLPHFLLHSVHLSLPGFGKTRTLLVFLHWCYSKHTSLLNCFRALGSWLVSHKCFLLRAWKDKTIHTSVSLSNYVLLNKISITVDWALTEYNQ